MILKSAASVVQKSVASVDAVTTTEQNKQSQLNKPNRVPHRVPIAELGDYLTCFLCKGYFVDATTIIECLHSFCRSCIVKYLESNKYCPVCDVQVHKTKPLLNIRPDKILQDIVYKLVPKLHHNETQRRNDFYAQHPGNKPSTLETRVETTYQYLLAPEEMLCISMVYHGAEKCALRYLRCSAAVTMAHLQKLIRNKYDLNLHHKVEILHQDDTLESYLTLMDVAYIYLWRRKLPLALTYRIYENTKRSGTQSKDSLQQENNNNDSNSSEEGWKEVQLRISENGEMSVTGIQDCLSLLDANILQDDKDLKDVSTKLEKSPSKKLKLEKKDKIKSITKDTRETRSTIQVKSTEATVDDVTSNEKCPEKEKEKKARKCLLGDVKQSEAKLKTNERKRKSLTREDESNHPNTNKQKEKNIQGVVVCKKSKLDELQSTLPACISISAKVDKPVILNHALGLQNLSNNHPLKKHSLLNPPKPITTTVATPPSGGLSNYQKQKDPQVLVNTPKMTMSTATTTSSIYTNSGNKSQYPTNTPGYPPGYFKPEPRYMPQPRFKSQPDVKQEVKSPGGPGALSPGGHPSAPPPGGSDLRNVRQKFFKARNNMPRYLGCPASGVKPMYNLQQVQQESPEKDKNGGGSGKDSKDLAAAKKEKKLCEGKSLEVRLGGAAQAAPSMSTEIKRHSIVKIDPKTLKPIAERAPDLTSLSFSPKSIVVTSSSSVVTPPDLKINTSSVSIFNPMKLQAERKSPHSPIGCKPRPPGSSPTAPVQGQGQSPGQTLANLGAGSSSTLTATAGLSLSPIVSSGSGSGGSGGRGSPGLTPMAKHKAANLSFTPSNPFVPTMSAAGGGGGNHQFMYPSATGYPYDPMMAAFFAYSPAPYNYELHKLAHAQMRQMGGPFGMQSMVMMNQPGALGVPPGIPPGVPGTPSKKMSKDKCRSMTTTTTTTTTTSCLPKQNCLSVTTIGCTSATATAKRACTSPMGGTKAGKSDKSLQNALDKLTKMAGSDVAVKTKSKIEIQSNITIVKGTTPLEVQEIKETVEVQEKLVVDQADKTKGLMLNAQNDDGKVGNVQHKEDKSGICEEFKAVNEFSKKNENEKVDETLNLSEDVAVACMIEQTSADKVDDVVQSGCSGEKLPEQGDLSGEMVATNVEIVHKVDKIEKVAFDEAINKQTDIVQHEEDKSLVVDDTQPVLKPGVSSVNEMKLSIVNPDVDIPSADGCTTSSVVCDDISPVVTAVTTSTTTELVNNEKNNEAKVDDNCKSDAKCTLN